MSGWIYLFIAILLEVSGTTCMKLSEGFSHILPSVLLFVFYIASFYFMTLALKTIDVSVAYAVWSGVGIALITLIGFFFFKESLNFIKILSLLLIVIGIIGLHLQAK
ncbi:DMT family transporter [Hippea alviniae]|uniref:DMT family transporter n=1 Tax=Hippea alviniae TaxID=1279027 RepID=UPI0003B31CC6|nr:multidrug efflux SMR transporter [Hippea alviniae]